jgi:hypothetical protein
MVEGQMTDDRGGNRAWQHMPHADHTANSGSLFAIIMRPSPGKQRSQRAV